MAQRIETDLEGKVSGYVVWRQDWIESERGWGTRSDGYSLHLDRSQVMQYVARYWREERKRNPGGEAPDCYVRDSGDPYKVIVDEKTYNAIKASKDGIRR